MKKGLFAILICLITISVPAKSYIIYNINQDFPMGEPNEVLKKDYYINMGSNQGIKKGTILDIYRDVLGVNPYKAKKIYPHKVKIGKIKIIHADEQSSIAKKEFFFDTPYNPNLEFKDFMIGDYVAVSVE